MRRLLPALVALAALVVPATPAATADGRTFTEGFSSPTWWRAWGLAEEPFRADRVSATGDPYLQVHFLPGSHDSASWMLPTGDADVVTLRYRIRFGPTWLPLAGGTGKLPGFGLPRFDPVTGRCTAACGKKPVDADDAAYSARGCFEGADNRGCSYLYTPPCAGGAVRARHMEVDDWQATFARGRWYTVEQTIAMNAPDRPDGSLRVRVDGRTVLSLQGVCFRRTADVHVGNVWMSFYYGGRSTPVVPMSLDIDRVSISW